VRIATSKSPARLIAATIVAATGIYLGVSLAVYAEADDAPGGVVLGAILILGSLALGIWIALRRARTQTANDG
jgi:membrane protein DedA with SNARE-associated domain